MGGALVKLTRVLRVEFRSEGAELQARLAGAGIQDAAWRAIKAPLAAEELEDLRWYVEDFMRLPVGGYRVRATRVEQLLASAGQRLFRATFSDADAGRALDRVLGSSDSWLEISAEAGTPAEPLAWPWELLHDGDGFMATRRLRVRRTVPRARVAPKRPPQGRELRVLVLVARPDDQGLATPHATIDAMIRATADKPVNIDVCSVGTLKELSRRLAEAHDHEAPYDVVHINAHGNYHAGAGAELAFEKEPDDDGRILTDAIGPDALGQKLHDKGVDLVILEACRSSMTDAAAPLAAGFAQGLLEKGLGAVIAMGYTVHVDATKTLFGEFYDKIASGSTVGAALTHARERLSDEPRRRVGFRPGQPRSEVKLNDWYVPQLYQRGEDVAFIAKPEKAPPRARPPELPRPAPGNSPPGAFPPACPHELVGRVAERYRIERSLARSSAVLVHGLAGMGKTTLAAEVAAWLLRVRRVDKACFVDFRSVISEDHALSIMGAALAGAQIVEREAIVRRFRSERVLVVWDNLETLNDVSSGEAARLTSLFAELTRDDGGPPVAGRLLLTSRDPRPGSLGVPFAVELSGLWRPDARELLRRVLRPASFGEILKRQGTAAGAPDDEESITKAGHKAIDDLLGFLGDHPLSIELVGPALASETAAAIMAGIVAKLEDAPAGSDSEERRRKLLGALAWSVDRLDESACEAVRWLSLFRGGVFEDNLLDISGLDPVAWAAARDQLVRGGLVAVDGSVQLNAKPYLVLHPTLVLLGSEALQEKDAVRAQFAAVYGSVAGGVEMVLRGSARREALCIFESEEANWRRAIAWATPETASFLRHVGARCLTSLGRVADAQALGDVAEEAGLSWQARVHQAWALFERDPQRGLGRLAALARELSPAPEGSLPEDAALAFAMHGRALLVLRLPDQAVQQLAEGVRRFRDVTKGCDPSDVRWGNLSAALGDLGSVYLSLRRFGAAEQAVREGLRIDGVRGAQRDLAVGHALLGRSLFAQGRIDDARREYDRALAAARELGDRGLQGSLEQHVGGLNADAGAFDAADAHLQRALALFLTGGDRRGAMRTRNLLGSLHHRRDDLASARSWHEAALADCVALRDEHYRAVTLHHLGALATSEARAARGANLDSTAQAKLEEAATFVLESFAILERRGHDAAAAASSICSPRRLRWPRRLRSLSSRFKRTARSAGIRNAVFASRSARPQARTRSRVPSCRVF